MTKKIMAPSTQQTISISYPENLPDLILQAISKLVSRTAIALSDSNSITISHAILETLGSTQLKITYYQDKGKITREEIIPIVAAYSALQSGINQIRLMDLDDVLEEDAIAQLKQALQKHLPFEVTEKSISHEQDRTSRVVVKDVLSSEVELTSNYLSKVIAPYIESIIGFQHLIDEIKGSTLSQVKIRSIAQNSPVSISLDGASEAIQLIKETIVPWRRKHAETMAHLLEQERLIEIESIKADVLEKRARAARERGEVGRLKLEKEQLRLEIELNQAKTQLTLEILDRLTIRDITSEEREIYVKKLLPIMDILALGRLEIM